MSKIFLEILNTGIMAGWLVLAVLLVRVVLKKAPAWIQCALWAIVGLRLVWPFEFQSVLSLIPSTQTLPPSQLYADIPQVNTGIPVLNSAVNPAFTQAFAPQPSNSVNPLQVATEVASWIWLMGMLVLAVYAAVSYLRLRREVRVSMPAGEGVYLCDNITSPFILGIFCPKIYLPSALLRENWEPILAHERAHLARRDHWWKPLGFLLLTVFWFHPLLWVAYILLCRDVELACDERVIGALSPEEKQSYSQILLACSVPRKWITACPLAFGETGVKQRIKAILHYKKPTLWLLIVALIACSVLAVCFLTEPEEEVSPYPSDTYVTGELVNQVINTGYFADVNGTFRITGDGILQFDPATPTPNATWKDVDWQDLGVLEEFALTEQNFDDRFIDVSSLADTLQDIRANNRKAWRVPSDYGEYHYFLLQNDGTCYFMYGQRWLYRLRDSNWLSVAGKVFVYEETDAYGNFFTIHLFEDGTFQYSEGLLSSYIGIGSWESKNGKLYLYDVGLSKTRTYVFTIGENQLAFSALESDKFSYATVENGGVFLAAKQNDTDVPAYKQERNLIWVQVESVKDGHMLALDKDRNRWHIVLPKDIERLDYSSDACWVSFYGTPEKLTNKSYSGYSIQYEVTATACWERIRANSAWENRDDQGFRLWSAYDYCLYDIDGDGVLEECILSVGPTSGLFTLTLSVWDGETCEFSTILHMPHARAFAFFDDNQGLYFQSNTGLCHHIVYANGTICILKIADLIQKS